MARPPKPWFRAERSAWCVNYRGTLHQLGSHPEGFPAPRQVKGKWNPPPPILQAFHALLSTPAPVAPIRKTSGLTVPDVFDSFLGWCQKNRAPRTYEWSRDHIQNFLDSLPNKRLPVADLKPFHVQQWVDSKGWGANHTRGGITAVQRAFAWAEQVGHIDKNPIRRIEKPSPKRREQVLTLAEFQTILSHVKDSAFRDVLEFCWETGARVCEIRLIETAHCKEGRIEIPPAKAKGKKRWRVIYLTERAEAIVKKLAVREGFLFRNTDGKQWDAQNFNCRFCRLHKKLGVKYALTALRHSFATRLLEAGIDHLTVSALLGHVDGSVVLSRTYSHIGSNKDYLRDELKRGCAGK